MEYLDLSGNELTGTIPTALCSLEAILQLQLAENSLHGQIPPCMFTSLTSMNLLDLSVNPLTGELPPTLAGGDKSLGKLQSLYLANTELSGNLPAWLWRLPALREVKLSFSDFTGPLVSEGTEVSAPLTMIEASNCDLTGPLPPALCSATGLKTLDFSRNRLSGDLPSCMVQWEKLQRLSLGSNRLSGAVPDGVGNLSLLEAVDLSQNLI